MAKRKEWGWSNKSWKEERNGKPYSINEAVEEFKHYYKTGRSIIDEHIEEGKKKKADRNKKVEELRLKMGLKPSKTFGGNSK